VPEAEGKLQGSTVTIGPSSRRQPDRHADLPARTMKAPNNLVPLLRPLISPNNTINVNPGSNSLVITDYADNLQRLARIIAAMDMPNATDIEVIPLKHALAVRPGAAGAHPADAAANAAGGGQGQVDNSFRTAIIAEPRSNALIVRAANPARVALVRSLVERLDQPIVGDAAGQHPCGLSEECRGGEAGHDLARGHGGARATAAAVSRQPARRPRRPRLPQLPRHRSERQPSTGGQIQADPATNSLVITAPEPQYRQLRAVIDQLDARRAQVYVESLIAEVNADKAAEFGIQWQGADRQERRRQHRPPGHQFRRWRQQHHHAGHRAAGGGAGAGLNVGVANRDQRHLCAGFPGPLPAADRRRQHPVHAQPADAGQRGGQDRDRPERALRDRLLHQQQCRQQRHRQSVPDHRAQGRRPDAAGQAADQRERHRQAVDLPGGLQRAGVVDQLADRADHQQALDRVECAGEDGAIVVLGGLLQDEYAGNQDKVPGLGDVPLFGNLFKQREPLAQEDQPDGVPASGGGA
jgi:general secretion pathway protein D